MNTRFRTNWYKQSIFLRYTRVTAKGYPGPAAARYLMVIVRRFHLLANGPWAGRRPTRTWLVKSVPQDCIPPSITQALPHNRLFGWFFKNCKGAHHQPATATIGDDGTLTLRLQLPDCLAEEYGKYVVIAGVRFAYGHEQVLAALASNAEYTAYRRRHGDKAARGTALGQAISYRFKRDAKGWRVFATTQMMDVPVVTDRRRGAIGVDLNADHLAVADTDASGNCLKAWRVPLVTYGKSQSQAEALIGDAVASVVQYAREVGKPIVIEKLDFRQKKSALEGESRRYSRMLSSFSYGKIKAYFISRGYREGVEVHQVNPAYSSVIGRVKFMERYGLTVHQAAALVLARRLLGCSERIPRRWVCPVGNGVHVAFTVPARKRVKHVWTYWGAVSGQLRPALAAQHRLGKRRRGPNPVRAVARGETRGVA